MRDKSADQKDRSLVNKLVGKRVAKRLRREGKIAPPSPNTTEQKVKTDD